MSIADLLALDPTIGTLFDRAAAERGNRARIYARYRLALEHYVGFGRLRGPAELQTSEAYEIAVCELARRLGC